MKNLLLLCTKEKYNAQCDEHRFASYEIIKLHKRLQPTVVRWNVTQNKFRQSHPIGNIYAYIYYVEGKFIWLFTLSFSTLIPACVCFDFHMPRYQFYQCVDRSNFRAFLIAS